MTRPAGDWKCISVEQNLKTEKQTFFLDSQWQFLLNFSSACFTNTIYMWQQTRNSEAPTKCRQVLYRQKPTTTDNIDGQRDNYYSPSTDKQIRKRTIDYHYKMYKLEQDTICTVKTRRQGLASKGTSFLETPAIAHNVTQHYSLSTA